ncbi:MAG: ribonuclease III [Planctomycetota bacterium]
MTHSPESDRINAVFRALGYSFRDEPLLARALRHASAGGVDGTDNERLEFLGDAVIGLATAAWLYERHPDANEGNLTERRALVVSRAHLARVARRIGLEPLLETRLQGTASRARVPDSVVGGALEALVGAIYVEAGVDVAARVVQSLLKEDDDPEPILNTKAALQHITQVRFSCVPNYKVVEERMHTFGKSFCIAADVNGRLFPSAWGKSKREAERLAAREAMMELAFEEQNGAPEEI